MLRVTYAGALGRHRTVALLAATVLLLGTAGGGLAANTRLVYFGAPPKPDVCPIASTTTDPAPCGGGVDPATGKPRDGLLYFSPPIISTSTATTKLVGFRVQIGNLGSSTLTKVVVLGGALAGKTTNAINPPPSSRGYGSSLPAGFKFHAAYAVSGPVPTCTISASAPAKQRDSLRCDFGNIASGATPTILTIVLDSPTTIPTDPWFPTPWVELQGKEGSSTTGGNTDTFYAVAAPSALQVTASTLTYVQSFVEPQGGLLTTRDDFVPTSADPTATRVVVPKTGNGENVRVEETGTSADVVAGCATNVADITCYGQVSQVSVTTPANFFNGSGTADTFGIVDPQDSTKWLVQPLRLDFRWDSKSLPGKLSIKNLEIVHDGILISTRCAFDSQGVVVTTQVLPCRTEAVQFSDKDLGLTVYSDKNGGFSKGGR